MPTAGAVDRVALKTNKEIFETPTGWKFFGNLMDAQRLSLAAKRALARVLITSERRTACGAVLAWLSVLANTRKGVEEILVNHWNKFGRNFFTRFVLELRLNWLVVFHWLLISDMITKIVRQSHRMKWWPNWRNLLSGPDFVGKTFRSGDKEVYGFSADTLIQRPHRWKFDYKSRHSTHFQRRLKAYIPVKWDWQSGRPHSAIRGLLWEREVTEVEADAQEVTQPRIDIALQISQS